MSGLQRMTQRREVNFWKHKLQKASVNTLKQVEHFRFEVVKTLNLQREIQVYILTILREINMPTILVYK